MTTVRERDLPRSLRRARGAVMSARQAERIGWRPLGSSTRLKSHEDAARLRWYGSAQEQWAAATTHLLCWGLS